MCLRGLEGQGLGIELNSSVQVEGLAFWGSCENIWFCASL